MKTTTLTLMIAFVPAALVAQATGQVQGSSQGSVSVQAKKGSTSAQASGESQTSADGKAGKGSMSGTASSSTSADANIEMQAPREWTAGARDRLHAIYAEAREQKLPLRPIARRVAEGRAKGAAEGTIIASAGSVKADLSSAQDAMVVAGREHPSDGELQFAANAIERGVTKAQISELVRHTPSDRSLVVAFDVLGKLTARGVPASDAVAQVQSRIDAHASDASIGALAANTATTIGGTAGTMAGGSGNATGSASGTAGKASGSVAGSAGATAGAAGAAAAGTATGGANAAGRGVTGTVAGTVTGTVKKP